MPVPLCWLCRTFLARAETAVPKESVASAAAGLCRVLPVVVAGACQCLAQRYAVLAVEGLLGRVAPRLLCHLLLSCRNEDGDVAMVAPALRGLETTRAPTGAACAGTKVSAGRGAALGGGLLARPGPWGWHKASKGDTVPRDRSWGDTVPGDTRDWSQGVPQLLWGTPWGVTAPGDMSWGPK